MLQKILPSEVYSVIEGRLNSDLLYEVRLRGGMPVLVNYGGKYYYLTQKGISEQSENAIVCFAWQINDLVVKATEYSLYAVNNQLLNGFITVSGGIRIGVCGECVRNDDKIVTLKNFTAVNVRFPHEVLGCGEIAMRYIDGEQLFSTLIVSPPGCGKTTILRDICKNIGAKKIRNVLLIDERSEIASVNNGKPSLEVGMTTDVIHNTNKDYAFKYAVRSMRPDVIITDEIISETDSEAVALAISSGITVIASVHAKNKDELAIKKPTKNLIASKLISRYVFLSDRNGPGSYESVYDSNLNLIEQLCC